jgi:hypothetical protein
LLRTGNCGQSRDQDKTDVFEALMRLSEGRCEEFSRRLARHFGLIFNPLDINKAVSSLHPSTPIGGTRGELKRHRNANDGARAMQNSVPLPSTLKEYNA